jgi:hypothetical protein
LGLRRFDSGTSSESSQKRKTASPSYTFVVLNTLWKNPGKTTTM